MASENAERVEAIRLIRRFVVDGMYSNGVPQRLAESLFDKLEDAVGKGLSSGGVSRTAARASVAAAAESTFTSAVATIAQKLRACRDAQKDLPDSVEKRDGVACVRYAIGGQHFFVYVRGPASSHRAPGTSDDRQIQLDAEFQPIGHEPESTARGPHDEQGHFKHPRMRRIAVVGIAGAAAIVFASVLRFRRAPDSHVAVKTFEIPAWSAEYDHPWSIRIAPDQTYVAFTAQDRRATTPTRSIFVHSVESDKTWPLPVNGVMLPSFFWSRDSSGIYFVDGGKLYWIGRDGRGMRVIANVGHVTRGDENVDGVILVGSTSGVFAVQNGSIRAITRVDRRAGETAHYHPSFMPDGRHFLFLCVSRSPTGNPVNTLRVETVDGREGRAIPDVESRAEYSAGYLIYARAGKLQARPFDLQQMHFTGPEISLNRSVWYDLSSGDCDFSATMSGALAWKQPPEREDPIRLRIDARGRITKDTIHIDHVAALAVTRDGSEAVVARFNESNAVQQLWLWHLRDGSHRCLTCEDVPHGSSTSPVLSPDEKTVYFAGDRTGSPHMYRMRLDSEAAEELVFSAGGTQAPRGISPDGRTLLFQWWAARDADLYALPLDRPTDKASPLVKTADLEGESARFSPDGRSVVYGAHRHGANGVYLLQLGRSSDRRLSANDGWRARWAPDGRSVFYASGHDLFRVDVSPAILAPTLVTTLAAGIADIELAGDGSIFVVQESVEKNYFYTTDWRQSLLAKSDEGNPDTPVITRSARDIWRSTSRRRSTASVLLRRSAGRATDRP